MANQNYQREQWQDRGQRESASDDSQRFGSARQAGRDERQHQAYDSRSGNPQGGQRESQGDRFGGGSQRQYQDDYRNDQFAPYGYGQQSDGSGPGRYGFDQQGDRQRAQGSYYDRDYQGGESYRGHQSGGYRGDGYQSAGERGDYGGRGYQGSYGSSWDNDRLREEQQRGASSGAYGSPGGFGGNMWGGDEQRSGQSHRGRGPKNYQRSDERIREDVSDRLTDDHDVDASDIDVSVSDREVTLSGQVDSKQAKRRAEDCADSCSGVEHVQNNLRIKKAESGESGQTATTAKSK